MRIERRIDVQEFLNAHRFSSFQWLIFALCFFIVLLDGFDTAAIGYIAPSLISEWGLPKPALAPVLSAALFGLAAGALCAGPLRPKTRSHNLGPFVRYRLSRIFAIRRSHIVDRLPSYHGIGVGRRNAQR